MKEYGTIGGSLTNTSFDKQRVKSGLWGEKETGKMFKESFKREDVHIFHDLTVPNLKFANIDHLIVRGKTIFVVDSKNWSPGIYWNIGDSGFRGFKKFDPLTKKHVQAANAYFTKEFSEFEVKSVIIAWSKNKTKNHVFLTSGLEVKILAGNKAANWIKRQSSKKRAINQEEIKKLEGLLI